MAKWFSVLLVCAAFTAPLAAEGAFKISSTAVVGKPETGFDSKLVSAGRADPAYNGTVSLPFTWSGLPKGTKSLAVVYDDPDARLVMKAFGLDGSAWVHWLVADVDPALGGLKADAAQQGKLIMGTNSAGSLTYGGPAPPADVPADAARPIVHVYRLKVYALSSQTGLEAGFDADDLEKAMKGKVLGMAQLNLSWSN